MVTDEDKGDGKLKVPGPIRRNAVLLTAVVVVLIVGPAISGFLEAYRGIVLEVTQGQMLVYTSDQRAPEWKSAIDGVAPGQMVEKERGRWSAQIVERAPGDRQREQRYTRYNRTYKGTITRIKKSDRPNIPDTAIVTLDEGGKVSVRLLTEALSGAVEHQRVEKLRGSWDPVLLDEIVTPKAPPEAPAPSEE